MSLTVEGLCKAYGEKRVLEDFSLVLPERGVATFFGPSGCGKTTLLHLLAGLLTPERGQIMGREGHIVSMVFQEDRLLPWCTVEENLCLVNPNLSRAEVRERLERVGLEGARGQYPEELSGGMRRRAAFARALAYGGDVLLLDEPFKGQDRMVKERLFAETAAFAQRGLVLLITHDPEEAALLSWQVYLFSGPPLTLERRLDWGEPLERREDLASLQSQLG